jgi:hypothetical protein
MVQIHSPRPFFSTTSIQFPPNLGFSSAAIAFEKHLSGEWPRPVEFFYARHLQSSKH